MRRTAARHPGDDNIGTHARCCAALLAGLLAACDRGAPGEGAAGGFSVDDAAGTWTTDPGTAAAPADAQFHRHGVATGVQLRARDGQQAIELFGSFLGEASAPVFIALKVAYEDGDGTVFEHAAPLDAANQGAGGVRWRRLELDEDAGTGYAEVSVDVPVCVDVYSGPLEYETRCHRIDGSFATALVHSRSLRVVR